MDLFEVIRTRRSIRKFHPDPVPDGDLRQILEAARLAPSSNNQQPWKFIVIRDRERIAEMARAVNGVFDRQVEVDPEEERRLAESNMRFFSTHFGEAPLVIIPLAQGEERPGLTPYVNSDDLQSIGAAIQNMLLAATALGYGTCWMTGPVESAGEQLAQMLDIRSPWTAIACIPVGRPAWNPRPRPCKTLEEITVFVGPPLAEEG